MVFLGHSFLHMSILFCVKWKDLLADGGSNTGGASTLGVGGSRIMMSLMPISYLYIFLDLARGELQLTSFIELI